MIFESLTLVAIGLVVVLSGAIIPGPLLAFTLFDTSKKRRSTEHSTNMRIEYNRSIESWREHGSLLWSRESEILSLVPLDWSRRDGWR